MVLCRCHLLFSAPLHYIISLSNVSPAHTHTHTHTPAAVLSIRWLLAMLIYLLLCHLFCGECDFDLIGHQHENVKFMNVRGTRLIWTGKKILASFDVKQSHLLSIRIVHINNTLAQSNESIHLDARPNVAGDGAADVKLRAQFRPDPRPWNAHFSQRNGRARPTTAGRGQCERQRNLF